MERNYCNTIIGSAAEGARYYKRTKVEKKILSQLRKGVFVHFTAPRRVGKTSVLKSLAKQSHENLICVFENIESDRTSADLYKRLIGLIQQACTLEKGMWNKALSYLKSKKVTGLSLEGISLEHSGINYKNLFLSLVDAIQENDMKIILLVDEFPDVIANIKRNEDNEAALDVLNTLRSIRQRESFRNAFGLVLSGSIGLTHVVRGIGRPKLINDLAIVNLDTLNDKQFDEFICFLTDNATLHIPEKVQNYIKGRLQQFIPYYIQLIVEQGDELTDDEERIELTIEDVDLIYVNLTRDNDKFIDWVDRIKEYYKEEYPFLKEVLTIAAHKERINIQKIANVANKTKQDGYEELIHQVLIKDGYLFKTADNNYAFASPLLRDWWKYHYSL